MRIGIVIVFTKHARLKFIVLKRHGVMVSEKQVIQTIQSPELMDYSRLPLLIAQRSLTRNHVLRVVYTKEKETIKIITFYPGRKKHYEK